MQNRRHISVSNFISGGLFGKSPGKVKMAEKIPPAPLIAIPRKQGLTRAFQSHTKQMPPVIVALKARRTSSERGECDACAGKQDPGTNRKAPDDDGRLLGVPGRQAAMPPADISTKDPKLDNGIGNYDIVAMRAPCQHVILRKKYADPVCNTMHEYR